MGRLTVEFPDQVTEILSKLAKEDQTTKTEVIRRALALYNYLHEHGVKKGDRKLSITDKDDTIIKDIVF